MAKNSYILLTSYAYEFISPDENGNIRKKMLELLIRGPLLALIVVAIFCLLPLADKTWAMMTRPRVKYMFP